MARRPRQPVCIHAQRDHAVVNIERADDSDALSAAIVTATGNSAEQVEDAMADGLADNR